MLHSIPSLCNVPEIVTTTSVKSRTKQQPLPAIVPLPQVDGVERGLGLAYLLGTKRTVPLPPGAALSNSSPLCSRSLFFPLHSLSPLPTHPTPTHSFFFFFFSSCPFYLQPGTSSSPVLSTSRPVFILSSPQLEPHSPFRCHHPPSSTSPLASLSRSVASESRRTSKQARKKSESTGPS